MSRVEDEYVPAVGSDTSLISVFAFSGLPSLLVPARREVGPSYVVYSDLC